MVHDLTDDMLDAALAKGEVERAKTPVAIAAEYDRGARQVVIKFENGASLSIPVNALQGLQDASDEDIASVELEHGYALHWERLDVDFTIPGLMAGIFGTASYMAANAGRIKSDAKTAAARENGRKGGRPRLTTGDVLVVMAGETTPLSGKKGKRVFRQTMTGKLLSGSVLSQDERREQDPRKTVLIRSLEKTNRKD